MDQLADIDELQVIADYRKAYKTLRLVTRAAIIWGIINTAQGVWFLQWGGIINIVLVVIGLFMLVEGVWNWLVPTAKGIIFDGIVFLIVGSWNIFITILDSLRGFPPRVQWAIIGVCMIGFAIYRFFSYNHFSKAFSKKPSKEELDNMDELIRTILESKASTADDMFLFEQKNFLKQQTWKGKLGTEAVVFVNKTGQEVLVGHKDQIDFTVRRKVLLGKKLKASFQVRDRKMKGLISPEYFQRFEAWKMSNPSLA